MKSESEPLKKLKDLFHEQLCWMIDPLCLEMDYAPILIRRFLNQLGYFTSFTHNSRYYTLTSTLQFNKKGLWFYSDIGFSKRGNLKRTIIDFINKSPQGLVASQLAAILQQPCHTVLKQLYKGKKIDRIKPAAEFVYFSSDPSRYKNQYMRLQVTSENTRVPQRLLPQVAIHVFAEAIKHPDASYKELSRLAAKKQLIANAESISLLFDEHGIKKKLI